MSEHHGPHISPLSMYYKVYGSLLVLTIITVGLSMWLVPAFGISSQLSLVLAMLVAVVKATLVGAFFMHLLHDKKFNILLFLSSVWFISLFFIFTLVDLGSRGDILQIMDNFELRMDQAQDKAGIPAASAAPAPEGQAPAPADDAADEGAVAAVSDFDAKGTYDMVCVACHGAAGDGNGPAGAALNPKPANFTDAAFWAERDDALVHKAIKEGGPSVGKSALMAPYGGQYSDEQITALVEHLKTFKPAE